MENGIMFTVGKDGVMRERKEPYATVKCETEEDYNRLLELLEKGKFVEGQAYIKIGDEAIIDNCEDEIYIVTDVSLIHSYKNNKSRFKCSLKYKDCDMNLSSSIDSDRLTIV